MLKDLVSKSRSTRRYIEDQSVDIDTLRSLVDLARLAPTGRNRQALKFLLSCTRERNARIFACLSWPQFGEWTEPLPGERPAAYIAILGDTRLAEHFAVDTGIAAQTIMLGLADLGLAGCIHGTVDEERLRAGISIPGYYKIGVVISLGKPGERVQVDPIGPDGSVALRRDAAGVHHVPKRSLEDLIVEF